MASSEQGKKLSDLLVIELRTYLKQRQLDHIGTKAVLVERLQQSLISDGIDPNTHLFNMGKPVNIKMESQEKEATPEAETTIWEETQDQVENDFNILEIEASTSETNFEETPMEIEIMDVDSAEILAPSVSENETKNADDEEKAKLEAEINESFVLMIDELISDKFLEETQNEENVEVDFVDADDVTSNEVDKDKTSDDVDPLNVEPLKTGEEEEKQNDEDLVVEATTKSNEVEDLNKVQETQEKICSKELIVVVKREDLLKNKRKLMQQSDDNDKELPLDIKIKEEIIILSDDEMDNEESNIFNQIKEEPFDNIETEANNETKSNLEKDETKSDVSEKEQPVIGVESSDSSLDKENENIHNLKIENLISSVKAQELRQLLCDYAKVLEVKVFHDNKKIYCHAFANVEVKDLDGMLEKLNTLEYKGTVLSVTKINKTNVSANKEIQLRCIKDLQKKKLDPEEKIESNEVDRNLWVTNLLQNTRARDIKQLLSQHAKVIGVKIVKSPSKNCYGYVTLESKSDVDLCIQRLDRTTFNGRVIRLSATKKAPVYSVIDKSAKKSPEKEPKGPNNIKSSDKKKTPEKSTKKSDDLKKEDDKRSDTNKKESYEKNRNDRERHQREKDRIRIEEERIRQEVEHAREILRRQRDEARQLEREREKIRKEREYLERQRMEILRMERERQRIERDKIEKEKEELRRQQQKLEEARRAEKRASSSSNSSVLNKRPYISPKRDKNKKIEPQRPNEFSKENEDPGAFPKRHGDYVKRNDEYSKRNEDYQTKRPEEYPKQRSSDYHKRPDDYPKRADVYPRRDDYPKRVPEDFPKRFDHFGKPDEIYPKEDYHKRPEFPNYKREDRTIGSDFKRDYPGHSSHHVPSAVGNSGYKFDQTYHPDREKLIRPPPRKEIPTKDPKPIGYNDRSEITSTEAYRSILRDDRDRERKTGVDYNYKNETRVPLLKETPRYKDDGSSWAAGGTGGVKTFRDVENPNPPKDPWWRKWDGPQWSAGTSTDYPGVNYNSGPSCPPPPGINNYPMNSHFGNYRKY